MRALLFLIVVAAVCAAVFYGCNGADKNTQEQVGQKAQSALDATKNALQSAGKTIQKSSEQAEETFKVKGPIDASKDIDSSNLAVETIGKTVIISGSVPTQDQKEKVEKMAQANVDSGYKVENNLTVQPKTNDSGKDDKNPPITDDQGKT